MGVMVKRDQDVIDGSELRRTEKRSGRAVWDERGNSTWEWQTEPGVYSRDIDTQQLRTLVGEQLKIEDWQPPLRVVRRR